MKDPITGKELVPATAEEVLKYAQLRQSNQETGSFNDYIATLRDKDKDSITVDLRGANRRGNLQGVNLQGVNLQGANLEWAYLYEAQLQGAQLQGANLRGVGLLKHLQGTNLQGANLYGAYLPNANLQGANLQGANLQGIGLAEANLQGANLQGANLQQSRLEEANLQGANLTNTILIDVKNLPELSEEQRAQAILTWDVAAHRLITDPNLSLLDYNMPALYKAAMPETKAKLEAAFPRLQWDKPIEAQLKAAQEIFTIIRDFNLISAQHVAPSGENGLPQDAIWHAVRFDLRHRQAKAFLSEEQITIVENFALNANPGGGLSRDEAARYLLGGNGIPERWAKANQKEAGTSFRERFTRGLAEDGPKNWVERTSSSAGAERQL